MSEQSITPTLVASEPVISAAETLDETLVDGPGRRAPATSGRLSRGAMVGRYIVLNMLGWGGMGIVYAAYDPELDRKVALKLILPGHDDGVAARLRLQREAQAIAQLSHPNVVAVHDVGAVGDKVFIAMEFVEGMDLARWLAAEARPMARVLDMFHQAGVGLAAAHSAGLVHRDFKPENVLVGSDGRARVVDFGLVRRDEHSMSRESLQSSGELVEISGRRSRDDHDLQLTDAGAMVGTPAYMSPEQFSGLSGDARADQFSFCVSLYQGLYGERPFGGNSPADLSYAVLQGDIRDPPAKHEVPSRLRRVLLRGLAVEPDDRYPGMHALLAAVRKAAAPRRRAWALPSMLVLSGVGIGALFLHEPSSTEDPCASAGEAARVLWSQDRQDAIAAAFRGTGRPYAADTWARVEPRIDGYLEAWVELRGTVCEDHGGLEAASRADDPRARCLEERLTEVSDLLQVFEHADARTVTAAVKMASRLNTMDRCAEFDGVDESPVPSEPAMREQVQHLRSELRRWTFQTLSGHDEDTDRLFEDLAARIEALDYGPLRAELLDYQSGRAGAAGRLDESVALSNQAFEMALASRHDFFAFRSAVGLVFLHGVQRREPALAHRWARRAEALRMRFDSDSVSRLQLLNNEASTFALEGKYDQASALYEEALDAVRQLDDRVRLASVLNNIGAFHAERRELALAVTYLEEAASINGEVLGPDHPSVLRTRANLGITAVFDGRTEDGLTILEEVLPRQEAVLGESHPEIANTLSALAAARYRQERFEEAIAIRRRILAVQESTHGPLGRSALIARLNLAGVLMEVDQLHDARILLEQTLADVTTRTSSMTRLHVDSLVGLCRVSGRLVESEPAHQGHAAQGLRYGEALLALCRDQEEACDAKRRPRALACAARARLDSGNRSGARELYEKVVRLPAPEDEPWVLGKARFGLARATLDVDRTIAIAHARRAIVDLTGNDRASRGLVETIEAWLEEHDPKRSPDAPR